MICIQAYSLTLTHPVSSNKPLEKLPLPKNDDDFINIIPKKPNIDVPKMPTSVDVFKELSRRKNSKKKNNKNVFDDTKTSINNIEEEKKCRTEGKALSSQDSIQKSADQINDEFSLIDIDLVDDGDVLNKVLAPSSQGRETTTLLGQRDIAPSSQGRETTTLLGQRDIAP